MKSYRHWFGLSWSNVFSSERQDGMRVLSSESPRKKLKELRWSWSRNRSGDLQEMFRMKDSESKQAFFPW